LEATSSTSHYPSSPPPLHRPIEVKAEAPPLGARPTLETNLLASPIVKSGDPDYGYGSCKVEEEIPPSWKLENKAVTTKDITTGDDNAAGKEEEDHPQHFANHLVEEHL